MDVPKPSPVIRFTKAGSLELVLDATPKLIGPEVVNVGLCVLVEVGVHPPLGVRE